MRGTLTQQEELFCCYVCGTGDATLAARKAGYGEDAATRGTALLGRRVIRRRMQEIEALLPPQNAKRGLQRIAFGGVADAIRLIFCEDSDMLAALTPEALDLYNIAELRRAKDGGLDIKFYSRLEALKELAKWEAVETDGQTAAADFLSALAGGGKGTDTFEKDEADGV